MQGVYKINNPAPLNLIRQDLEYGAVVYAEHRVLTASRGRQQHPTSTRWMGVAPIWHFGGSDDADNLILTSIIPESYRQERQAVRKMELGRIPNLLLTTLDVDRPKGDPDGTDTNCLVSWKETGVGKITNESVDGRKGKWLGRPGYPTKNRVSGDTHINCQHNPVLIRQDSIDMPLSIAYDNLLLASYELSADANQSDSNNAHYHASRVKEDGTGKTVRFFAA